MYSCIAKVNVLLLLLLVCINHSDSNKTEGSAIEVKNSTSKNDTKINDASSLSLPDVNKVQLKNVTSTAETKPVNTQETEMKHSPRENVSESPINTNLSPTNETKVKNQTNTQNTLEKIEDTHNESSHGTVVSRKGVTFEPSSTKITPTTAKPLPQKPKITVGSEDDVPIANSYQDVPKPKEKSTTERIIGYHESFTEKKSHSSDYVIPIIAVILSVPLVAIIISVLYKRFKDWWTHRNYRRMDFLIEGMYNN